MALIAIRAVENVIAHTVVIVIGLRGRVANRALEHRIVARIRVAGSAHAPGIAVGHRKPGMVERSSAPPCCGVTGLAGCRKARGHVIRVAGGLVNGSVTAVAVSRKTCVIVVHVAAGAGDRGVRSRERETGRAVIERRAIPRHGVMAQIAGRRVSQLNVVDRRRRAVVIRLVARDAARAGQAVIIVDVTGTARSAGVRTAERPAGSRVVESACGPRGGRMAEGAVRRESGRRMAWIGGALEIRHMAGRAGSVGGGQGVVVVHMAGAAGRADVRPGKREARRRVIEGTAAPGRSGRMAGLAIR